jgi:toxin HigB-1
MLIRVVVISRRAEKDLRKVPERIAVKFAAWRDAVQRTGLQEVRKIPGYHDEPLHGDRKGQRSIRLSGGYRAIYIVKKDSIEFIEVHEIHNHAY